MSISAHIIADSLSPYGHRLTTYKLTMPRIVLAEFNTHRMISRNSASSRAIPFEKMLQSVNDNPFVPLRWMKEHKGMQGMEYFDNPYDISSHTSNWLAARDKAVDVASYMSRAGVSKQMCNRLLEPFMYHTVIATASEWENFFALRAHDAAEIHMQDLAFKMLDAYNASTPKQLKSGEWHAPFADQLDTERLINIAHGIVTRGKPEYAPSVVELQPVIDQLITKIATARCARVSYTVIGEEKDLHNYEKDVILHDRLAASGHFSPFEHCARVMTPHEYHYSKLTGWAAGSKPDHEQAGWCKNFRGFTQYRALLHNENKTDNRVRKEYAQQSHDATA